VKEVDRLLNDVLINFPHWGMLAVFWKLPPMVGVDLWLNDVLINFRHCRELVCASIYAPEISVTSSV
jgi:myo-inositol catabolism protein IolC